MSLGSQPRENRYSILTTVLAVFILSTCCAAAGNEPTPRLLKIESALVRIIDSVNLPASEPGIIESVHVREGDVVQCGDALAQLDARRATWQVRLTELAATVAKSRAASDIAIRLSDKTHALAETDKARVSGINARVPNTIPQSEVDRLQLEVDKTGLEIEHARHQQEISQLEWQHAAAEWEATRLDLELRTLRAPLNGMVVQVHKRAGEWVTAGDTVLRIVRVDQLRAEAFVDATQATPQLVGCPATLRVVISGDRQHSVAGTVTFVDVEADPVNAQVRVWMDFDNHLVALRPGLRGELTLQLPE